MMANFRYFVVWYTLPRLMMSIKRLRLTLLKAAMTTTYQKLQDKLENVQAGYNEVPNRPTDAKKHVNNIVNK